MKPYTPLSQEECSEILAVMNNHFGEKDYYEIFCEDTEFLGIVYDDGKTDKVSSGGYTGTALRVTEGDRTDLTTIQGDNYQNIIKLLNGNNEKNLQKKYTFNNLVFNPVSVMKKKYDSLNVSSKINILKEIDKQIRIKYKDVIQVTVSYRENCRKIFIANSEKQYLSDIQPNIVIAVRVCIKDGEEIRTGYESKGGQYGLEFLDEINPVDIGLEAARIAYVQVGAPPAPAGTFDVVLSSSAGGTMVHEACGHGLEADLVLKGYSIYNGRINEKVASEKVSVVDDGTINNLRGSAAIDDEGNPAKRVILIDKGILKGFLHSRKTAKKYNVEPTGNGRRESYQYLPIPRMRNTMIISGSDDPAKIIRSINKGILVKRMGGGEVDTITGNFVFYVEEGYWVENGKIKNPVRGATLMGNGPEVLEKIDMVGNDLGYSIGTCGKDGQGAPVSDAQPTIRIPGLIIGGEIGKNL